ncbi:GNAT family N-acetyltransferase [Zhongshania marina]|uniref:GNAT family N-acetyltransferase n=1 Tax=Zhongshania marina TaxID=2304603 RepID=A0A2S4HEE6_9GAMM|nr:GNAT family N-acetyltransferase [Marortus luteolus]POP52340.1 GNAT family N-acetyltransferase [Marortus luteolus]
MSEIEFLCFNQVNPEDFLGVVNEDSLRTHLIDHPYFDVASLQAWMEDKIKMDAVQGCRIRAVYIGGVLAGWCGIQPDDNGFELAIVISQKFWGFGIPIFKVLMCWANEMGHKEILFHLLESRPEYKALNRISTKVHKTEQLGRCFTSYHVPVGN